MTPLLPITTKPPTPLRAPMAPSTSLPLLEDACTRIPHTTRAMFGGHGFFANNGGMFAAIVDGDRIALKLPVPEDFAALVALGGKQWVYQDRMPMRAWAVVPDAFYDEPRTLAEWAKKASTTAEPGKQATKDEPEPPAKPKPAPAAKTPTPPAPTTSAKATPAAASAPAKPAPAPTKAAPPVKPATRPPAAPAKTAPAKPTKAPAKAPVKAAKPAPKPARPKPAAKAKAKAGGKKR